MQGLSAQVSDQLPRELAPGLFWLGQCALIEYGGEFIHAYNSVYVVAGADASVVVEGGAPFDLDVIQTQLDQLLDDGLPPVRFLFPTHPETNHSSGVGDLLERFPYSVLIGDPTDFHLNFPQYLDRLSERAARVPIDLGGREFFWVPGIFRDLPSTRWGFDTGSRALFTGDGLAYAHYHNAGHCAHTAEESIAEADSLDVQAMMRMFAEAAFYWTRYIDIDVFIDRLDALLEELDVKIIAPTHGLPIADVAALLPELHAGLRFGAEQTGETLR